MLNFILGIDISKKKLDAALTCDGKNYDCDFVKAEASIKTSLQLDPKNVRALTVALELATSLGYPEKAIETCKRAIALDPLRVRSYQMLSFSCLSMGKLSEAEAAIRKGIELSPGRSWSYYHLARIQLEQGKPEAALKTIRKEPEDSWRSYGLVLVYYKLKRHKEAEGLLKEVNKLGDAGAFQHGETYAYRGDKDLAFQWLDRAYEQRDPGLADVRVPSCSQAFTTIRGGCCF